ncbi:hypothetical protein BH20ACT16_BH20ACT16_15860 [soil metagenome]
MRRGLPHACRIDPGVRGRIGHGGEGAPPPPAPRPGTTSTLLTPACTLLTWFILDLVRNRQITAIGAATAIIVGRVGITPAGGFISPIWAMVLGVVVAFPCYYVVAWRPRTRVDETLDVLAAHGVAGLTGIVFIGFAAQQDWNGVADGLFYGDAGSWAHSSSRRWRRPCTRSG